MSIALVTAAFKAQMPHTAKFVLVALCDSANDQGECYPSVSALIDKCSLSERAVQKALADLAGMGCIRREFRNGRSTVYWVDPTAKPPQIVHPAPHAPPQQVHPSPADCAPAPPQIVHPTPASGAPITVNEPSIEPKAKERARVARTPPPDMPEGVDAQVWADWLTMRKAKRAPVTATVIAGATEQAELAGLTLTAFLKVWCRRGSQGLEASWLKPHERGSPGPPAESTWQREAREQVERMTGGLVSVKPPKPQLEIIDGCTRESRFSALG